LNTQTFLGTLVVEECYKCHCAFGITQDHHSRARASGDSFWCPNGHSQVYQVTEEQKLRKELEQAQRTVIRERNWRQSAEAEAAYQRRSKSALRGHLTRARNRVANGVCPVAGCHRHFDNVQAHIATVHPAWHLTDPETGKAAAL
jgi:hypothetical protein